MKRRALLIGSLLLPLASTKLLAEQSDDGIKRLAIQISDGDPKTYTKALNVAANFARGMSSKGEMFEIEIVAFNAGINLLRTDKSPMIDRVKSLSESIPDITFSACGNTIAGITRKEGKAPPISEYARVVPGGVGRLMVLDNEGYFVIRP
jgi:intracellular sulfur oxidation DsrE/DsrF family protein|tara:strand:+ start:4053 stop:4502 length:450 start_codon:yes stop_codon:yes gene_type:complete